MMALSERSVEAGKLGLSYMRMPSIGVIRVTIAGRLHVLSVYEMFP